jgi:hypothetical protein
LSLAPNNPLKIWIIKAKCFVISKQRKMKEFVRLIHSYGSGGDRGGGEGVVGIGSCAVVVEFGDGDFGIPHMCDSVVLTNLRLGLLGSHIAAF